MIFGDPIVSLNGRLVRGGIQSEDWDGGTVADQTDTAGWRIERNGDAKFNAGTFRGALEAATIDIPDATSSGFHVDSTGIVTLGDPAASKVTMDHSDLANDTLEIRLDPATGMYALPSLGLYWQPAPAPGYGQASLLSGFHAVTGRRAVVSATGGVAPNQAMAFLFAADPALFPIVQATITARSDGVALIEFTAGLSVTRRGHARNASVATAIPTTGVWTAVPLAANPAGDALCPELAESGNGIQNVSGRTVWATLNGRGAWGSGMTAAGLRGIGIAVNGVVGPADLVHVAAGLGLNAQHGLAHEQELAPNDIVTLWGYAAGGGAGQSIGPGAVRLSVTIHSD